MKQIKRILVNGVEVDLCKFIKETNLSENILIKIAESGIPITSTNGDIAQIELE